MIDITGKKDAVEIKKRYQYEVDKSIDIVRKKVKWLYMMNHKLKGARGEIEKRKRNIEANEEKRLSLYSALYDLLMRETSFEKEMWVHTLSKMNANPVTINQKFNNTDIEEVACDAMQKYLERYPKYQSDSRFANITSEVKTLDGNIEYTKKKLNEAISNVKRECDYFPRNIMEAKNNVNTYFNILQEGSTALENMRYVGGFCYRISGESKKLKYRIDTLGHRVDELIATINKIEEEVIGAIEEINMYN